MIELIMLMTVCFGTTTGTLGPVPPRPVLFRSPAQRFDPCVDLCHDFRADRFGDGFDLCDSPLQSNCIEDDSLPEPYCEYLYWSVNEEGLPGLVYSVNGTDLTAEERSNPLICTQANQIVRQRVLHDLLPPEWFER